MPLKLVDIKSAPYERNPSTGCTKCSATAQSNGRSFGINLPRGNAKYAVIEQPIVDEEHYIGSIKPPQQIDLTKINENNNEDVAKYANFVDLALKGSPTPNGQKYGHRAIAFLDAQDNKRYILDPYYNHKNTSPIPLDQYSKKGDIIQANFYNSPVQAA